MENPWNTFTYSFRHSADSTQPKAANSAPGICGTNFSFRSGSVWNISANRSVRIPIKTSFVTPEFKTAATGIFGSPGGAGRFANSSSPVSQLMKSTAAATMFFQKTMKISVSASPKIITRV